MGSDLGDESGLRAQSCSPGRLVAATAATASPAKRTRSVAIACWTTGSAQNAGIGERVSPKDIDVASQPAEEIQGFGIRRLQCRLFSELLEGRRSASRKDEYSPADQVRQIAV